MSASLEGVAVGGPLDGIKIQGGRSWHGRVERDLSGRYVWNELRSTWIWKVNDVQTVVTRRPGRPRKVTAET